jgi:hypothetical protein
VQRAKNAIASLDKQQVLCVSRDNIRDNIVHEDIYKAFDLVVCLAETMVSVLRL